MEEVILNAFERTAENKKFKEDGFIAGVIYGDSIKEATSVKFELLPLKKILVQHGSNAKVWVALGKDKKFGFIKEIQRHAVTAKINHIDVQLVSKNHEIKLQLPISFKGEETLISRLLQLQILKSDIEVFGKMALMPDSVSVDVSEKEFGDTITIKDFSLDEQLKINDKADEVYATVVEFKDQLNTEVTDEAVSAEPEVKTA
ncbi:MAG: 50S ribosomal protein L25 [Clostridiaceae bacterium]|nr:50S ribosomal protein L25 [Clostridiaceae bacterium]